MEFQQLVDAIAERSGLTVDDVREQFRLLVEQIDETAQAGKALEIRGMGLFYLSTEGDLVFDPSEELATEINYRYAGMEPVLITPGSERKSESPSSPPGGDEIEKTLTEMFGEEKPEEDPEPEFEPDEESAPTETPVDEGAEEIEETPGETATEDPFGISPTAKSDEKEPEKKPKKTAESHKDSGSDAERKKGKDGSRSGKATTAKPRMKRRPPGRRGWRRKEKKERDPIRHLIKTLVAILILGILFHFTLEELKERGIITDEPILQKEEQPLPEPPEIEEGPWYGMYGTVEPFQTYHTISLHAVRDRSRADELAGQLRSEGYRGVVSSVEHPEHGTLWRVSIGQFETEADAERSVLFLPDELRSDTFITEIETP